ncbi:hypothetical protein BRADI_5g18355v3 [Brachypodium distachyon]|uniref:Uncharacterized protein n=1 Tax=Brachypodium distachyon TaxID=15368 RepID=A0A2K2CHZ8_BRADI|nr:hypothetical protein BRADI_5g18355v3 [Brachypodium distachyon]
MSMHSMQTCKLPHSIFPPCSSLFLLSSPHVHIHVSHCFRAGCGPVQSFGEQGKNLTTGSLREAWRQDLDATLRGDHAALRCCRENLLQGPPTIFLACSASFTSEHVSL